MEKLVRDNIPDIIRLKGETCSTRVLSEDEYLEMLDKKLLEELSEYLTSCGVVSHEAEELADMIEVIYAVAEAKGVSEDSLNKIREEKAKKRGRFTKRIALLL